MSQECFRLPAKQLTCETNIQEQTEEPYTLVGILFDHWYTYAKMEDSAPANVEGIERVRMVTGAVYTLLSKWCHNLNVSIHDLCSVINRSDCQDSDKLSAKWQARTRTSH